MFGLWTVSLTSLHLQKEREARGELPLWECSWAETCDVNEREEGSYPYVTEVLPKTKANLEGQVRSTHFSIPKPVQHWRHCDVP